MSILTPEQQKIIERAEAMLEQTAAEGSTPFAGSSFEQALTSKELIPQTTPTLPTPKVDDTNFNAIVENGQGIIGANIPTTTTQDTPTEESSIDTRLNTLMSSLAPTPPSQEAAYQSALQGSGVDAAQQAMAAKQALVRSSQAKLAGIQAQIQGVINRRDAKNLQIEGEAGGIVTRDIIGRKQQDVNRQAAIEALPLQSAALAAQAAVAAAQGEAEFAQSTLKIAQDKLNMAFSLKSQDMQNAYDTKKENRAAIFDFLSNEQKSRADKIQKQEDRDFTTQQNNLNFAQSLSVEAIKNGQGDLAAQITTLDPKSPTYQQDLAELQGQIKSESEEDRELTISEATNLGVPIGTKLSEVTGITPTKEAKPATASQLTAAGFAQRVVQANNIFGEVEDKILNLSTAEFFIEKNKPNALQSPDMQSLLQAQRNFVNAVLRRESGAAIAPSEFTSAELQYFPQPGDSSRVIEQKRANRRLVQENLRRESGSAFVDTSLTNISESEKPTLVTQDISTKIDDAVTAGYKAPDILLFLGENNPDMLSSIEEARAADFNDEEILNFLKSQQ